MGDRRPNPPPPSLVDDLIDHSEQLHIPNVIPELPKTGDLHYDTKADQILVYDDGSNPEWKAVTPFQQPDWKMKYYVMRNAGGMISGIFAHPMDANMPENFTLYLPSHESPFQPLKAEEIEESDYGTHVAFETFPILEVERDSMNGILLKLPD